MKVTGTGAPSAPSAGKPARSASGFSLNQTAATPGSTAAAATSASAGLADVSALMALQGVEGPLERRRRAIKRGGGLLDRLDELKLALLSGEPDEGVMDRLGRVMREERPQNDDPGLSALLDQIDLRAAVEMAKAELRRSER